MKILFILILATLNVFAEDTYTFWVDNPTMVDAYWNIFNSMAALFNNDHDNSYSSLLKLVFLLGGFGVFFSGVIKSFQGSNASAGIVDFSKYMVVGVTLLTMIYSQRATMLIKSITFPTYCSYEVDQSTIGGAGGVSTGVAVGNIPMILAWSFQFANEIGRESTRLARMAFSPVTGDFTTSQSRSDFASYLSGIGNVMGVTLDKIGSNTAYGEANANVGYLFSKIINDCVYLPAAQTMDGTGELIINALKTTGNGQKTLNDLLVDSNIKVYKNPTDETQVTSLATGVTFNGTPPNGLLVSYYGETRTCGDAWGILNTKLESLKGSGKIECQDSLKNLFDPVAIQVLTGINAAPISHAREIALNAALANQLIDSQKNIALGEVPFASGKSIAEHVTSSIGTGHYMAEMLPYLQMGMRAVLYAFFPFVFVIVLLPGGIKVLLSYAQTLIWIELWTPTAAILNMFMSLIASNKFQDMYNSKGFNPLNGVQTFTDTAMLASVAGYLYASVPALTWLILKGSGHMLGNITGAMAGKMGANLDSNSINRDVGSMNQLKATNESREKKGLQTISLAEQDYMSANHAALVESGKFMANEGKLGELSTSSEASTKKSIADGSNEARLRLMYGDKGVDNTRASKAITDHSTDSNTQKALGIDNSNKAADMGIINAGKNVKDYSAMKQLLTSGKNLSSKEIYDNAIKMGMTDGTANLLANTTEAGRQKLMGMIDENGKLDTKRLGEAAKVLATEDTTKFLSTEKGQQALKEMTGIKDNKELANFVADINANKSLMNINADKTKQYALANIGAKHGLSRNEALSAFSSSEGLTQALNTTTGEKFLKHFGINKNSNNEEKANILEKIAQINSTQESIDTKSKGIVQSKVSNDSQIGSNVAEAINKLGVNSNLYSKRATAISVLGKDPGGSKEAKDLFNEIKDMSPKEQAAFFEKDSKKFIKAVQTIDNNGVSAKTYNDLVGDETYKNKKKMEINALNESSLAVGEIGGKIGGAQKQMEKYQNQIDSGNTIARDSFNGAKVMPGVISKDTWQNTLKRLDKDSGEKKSERYGELINKKDLTNNEKGELLQLTQKAKDNLKVQDMSDSEKIKMQGIMSKDIAAITEVYKTTSEGAKYEEMIAKGMNAEQAGELAASAEYQKFKEQDYRKGREDEWAAADYTQKLIKAGSTFSGAVTALVSNGVNGGSPYLKKLLGAKNDKELDQKLAGFGIKSNFHNEDKTGAPNNVNKEAPNNVNKKTPHKRNPNFLNIK